MKEYDPLAIHRAIVNLLRRRGLTITPRLWEEKPTEFYWAREGENKPVERIENARVEEESKGEGA